MAYQKTTWTNGVTPINANNLNKIENQLETNANDIDKLNNDIDKLNEDVLFTGNSSSNITLDSSIVNYSRLKIYFKRGEGYQNSVEVLVTSTTLANLISTIYLNGTMYIDQKQISITETALTVVANSIMYSSGGNVSVEPQNNIRITKIVGYK